MKNKPRAMRDSLLENIYQEMKSNKDVFFVTADFGSPVLDKLQANFPEQFVNVGIAEQNLINVSAGLALEGYTVFAYAIAPFITMRCFEQIRVNLALLSNVRNMNVNLIGVGAGFSYVVSGPTHQCYEDISLMRSMPNMEVLSPSDQFSAASLLEHCLDTTGPAYIRLDAQILEPVYPVDYQYIDAGFNVLEKGEKICLVSTGYMTHTAKRALGKILDKHNVKMGLIDLINISHFDESALLSHLSSYEVVLSLEEGFKQRGGLDVTLLSLINNRLNIHFESIAVEGGYRFEIGTRDDIHEKVGIGINSVVNRLSKFLTI